MASRLQSCCFNAPKARKTAQVASATSALTSKALPFGSTANSAGASTNSVELLDNLDRLLAQVDENGIIYQPIGDDDRLLIPLSLAVKLDLAQANIATRLKSVCERQAISRVPGDLKSWRSNAFTFDMITLAACCCTAVQEGKAASARTEQMQIKRLETITTIKASAGGSMRATLVCLDPAAQTLVISFRGTKVTSPVDWMTNTNGSAVISKRFFGPDNELKAHSGFLFVARSMAQKIHKIIATHAKSIKHVLLTGHSAGGAVASLLFARFKLSNTFPSLALHCVTFGAPPAMAPLPARISSSTPDSLFLSLVNQGDPVPRAEKAYIKTLLDVYVQPGPNRVIHFDPQELQCCGTVLILLDRNPDSDDRMVDMVDATLHIKSLLFGNVKAHWMAVYSDMIRALGDKRKSSSARSGNASR